MKVKPISILVAALFSASAIAAGQSSQGSSSSESKQPQAQSEQSQSQSPQSSAQSAQSAQSPELVKQAQEKLSAAGHDAGPSDGVMGPKTQAALKEFQQAKGIEASGQLDQETLAALEIGTPEGSASTGSSSSTGASAPSGSGSSSGASASPSSDSGSQPPSQPGATGKQQ